MVSINYQRFWQYTLVSLTILVSLVGCTSQPTPSESSPLEQQALPSGYASLDIGNPSLAGSSSFASGSYTLSGNGSDIGFIWDKFHFVYAPWVSNGKLQTRLANVSRGSSTGLGRYGVMVRETLTTTVADKMVSVHYLSDGRVRMNARTAPGQQATLVAEVSGLSLPLWVRIIRDSGTVFSGWYSSNGSTWTRLGTVTLADMTPNPVFGLVVASGNDTALDTATFDSTQFETSNLMTRLEFAAEQGTISPAAYGLNGFQATNPTVTSNASYQSHLEFMKPSLFRVHTWEMLRDSSDPRGWLSTSSQTWDANRVKDALEDLKFAGEDLMINIPGWPSWMDVNPKDGFLDADQVDAFAAFCARLVEIVNKENGFNVKYWEVTNEYDENYGGTQGLGGNVGRMGELVEIYNRAALAMKQVDATIQTGGPAFERGDLYTNVRDFINGVKDQGTLDFLSIHGYGAWEKGWSLERVYNRAYRPTNPEQTTGERSVILHVRDVRNILNELIPNRYVPLNLNEYNITSSFQNDYPEMRTNVGATFDALLMIGAIERGADWTNAWNEKDGIFGKMDDSYTPRVTMGTYQLFNTYLTGTRVGCSLSAKVSVVCMATKDGNRYSFVLVNRSPKTQKLFFSFNQLPASITSFERFEISAATLDTPLAPDRTVLSRSALETSYILIPPDSVTVITGQ